MQGNNRLRNYKQG